MTQNDEPIPIRRVRVAAIAAAAWSLLFAVPSFYWGLGGDFGIETIAADIEELGVVGDRPFSLAASVAKVVAGMVALAMLCRLRHRAALTAIAGLSGLVVLYGAASFVQHGLMLAGGLDLPDTLGQEAATWHLIVWDPWWMLGGALFLALSLLVRRRSS